MKRIHIAIFFLICFCAFSCKVIAADEAAAATADDAALTVLEGEIFVEVAKADKDDQFKVQTPTGVVAVRGTKFGLKVEKDGKSQVNVVDGVVAAVNDLGEVLLEKGMASEILKNVLPSKFDFDLGEYQQLLDLWKGGITKGKIKDFVKGKVKEKVQGEIKKNIGF